MASNKLTVQIQKPLRDVFSFTITPPNSKLWIPGVINEETNELPVRKGTIYTLQTMKDKFTVTVVDIKENEFVEWVSEHKNYHCKYSYKELDADLTELIYEEWVDKGEIDEPFTQDTLNKLKLVLEK